MEKTGHYLNATFLLPPQLNLAKFTLSYGVSENVLAELGVLLPLGVVVSAAAAAARLLGVLSRRHDGRRRR